MEKRNGLIVALIGAAGVVLAAVVSGIFDVASGSGGSTAAPPTASSSATAPPSTPAATTSTTAAAPSTQVNSPTPDVRNSGTFTLAMNSGVDLDSEAQNWGVIASNPKCYDRVTDIILTTQPPYGGINECNTTFASIDAEAPVEPSTCTNETAYTSNIDNRGDFIRTGNRACFLTQDGRYGILEIAEHDESRRGVELTVTTWESP